ncbi:MAG: LacI family DNA-binding transcriptional regulator [Sphaerochaetaceae bacterium]
MLSEEKKNQRAKITDVAQLANVSVATVSIILKDPQNNRFSEKTIQKVLAAAETLQYQPALFAQQMKGKHLSVIGLIIPDLMNHYYPEVTTGFTKQANSLGYNVILLNSNNSIDQEQVFTETLIRMRVAGVAICGVYSNDERETEMIKRLNSTGIPVVRFDRYNANEACPFVGIDNFHAGYFITEKLIQAGHEHICCLAPKNPVYIVSERCKGYVSAMKKHGLESACHSFEAKEYGSLYQTVQNIWESEAKPTALFTPGGDMDAIECIKTASTLKIDVPGDLSIAGFDDIYISNVIKPSLTTIRQPKFEIGEAAMKLLYKMMHNEELGERKILLPFEYVARESTRII